jgi:hypothetical protein
MRRLGNLGVCAYISGLVLSPGQRTAVVAAAAVGTLTAQSTSPFTTERCTVNLDSLKPGPDHMVPTLPPSFTRSEGR